MECKLKHAMNLCHCKPFFYVVGKEIPVCDIKGMLCLASSNWTQIECKECFPLCEEIRYVRAADNENDYVS